MKKILLFAKNGQLGWELQRALAPLGEVIALDYPEVDFTKPADLSAMVKEVSPDFLINPAAYTAVDKAETDRKTAFLVNRDAVKALAESAAELNIPFIHYSTDYVYDGTKGSPYIETDATNPLNVYGQSKLEGDLAVLEAGGVGMVLRTSWVYSMRQGGFVTKVLQWAREQETLRVVDDQISSPTSARMLAEVTALLLAKISEHSFEWLQDRTGIYHCAGSGACSRYEWAQKIIELDPHKEEQKVQRLERAKSSEFPMPADRPMISVLNSDKLSEVFGLRQPNWEIALRLMLAG
ncbi:MAG: dTDP-4-dehydrorhamnose reductase [Anaerolineaceae bacterium]|nr:dTDP-4-dehydrorhamnose reductase [Anaerolineaceae bacterium]MDD4043234.1 dTDP-4-dehydrorhamnose reductase [Anaerolineaceae bacterium]MDD4578396.1 dTDP-4-dehydrorhamnose reductase [Anaerolineaceae bacterium]